MEELTDIILLQRLKNNEEEAFTGIYNRYWQPLYSTAMSILQQGPLAEDLVQEVFISLWRRRNELEIEHLKAYLAKAVKFQVLKAIRNNKADGQFYERLQHVTAVIIKEDPLLGKEMQAIFARLTGTLPDDCREIFRLSREEGLTYLEIATRLHISVKTVEKKMSFSLRHFRTGLGKALLLLLLARIS
ncbi:RNA polymerase sigma-70 factor [Chitinophaga sp. MM2321]|uniref:RNA polymerase sigma-70 factor n=1 Tax=Chitinophaga sp. MM2321 TaxID=3137178 RepID=UPI0032D57701